MKTYVLTVSRNFPTTHKRKGQPTDFFSNIDLGLKKHTIRSNYPLWKKRIDEVNQGIAIISLRYWSSKPYCSPQIEYKQFGKDQIGIQKLCNTYLGWFIDDIDSDITTKILSKNDGLSLDDFKDWFRKAAMNDDMAIIHFTNLRY